MRRATKDCKLMRETSVERCWPDPGGSSRNEKQEKLDKNIVTQSGKKNKQSQHLETGKPDQSHFKDSRNYHELKDRNAND